MPTHAELRKGCNRVLDRLKGSVDRIPSCILCSLELCDYESLFQHLMLQHAVFCTSPADISEMDGFFDHLQSRLCGKALNDGKKKSEEACRWWCPVCEEPLAAPTPTVLEEHIITQRHQHWNTKTIPSLEPFCICVSAGSSKLSSSRSSTVHEEDGNEEEWVENNDSESDEDDDFNKPCICLFCSNESTDCLAHMCKEHNFDFPAVTRTRPDIRDEYDLIALINMVRRSVDLQRCPCCSATADALVGGEQENEAAASTIEVCVDKGFLEDHLRAFPSHRLPSSVAERTDADLIPFLPNDALLSLVVTSGEGFLKAEPSDPDFPMVPTLQEVIAAREAKSKV